jgi:hypothetical protein
MVKPEQLVPEDNQPGHHPEQEQDKPSGDAFVAKVQALARAESDDQPRNDEIVDLAQAERDLSPTDKVARAVGMPFALAATAVRDRLTD